MNDTTLPTKRKKAIIRKGFALYDWKVLLNSSRDLAMRKGLPLRAFTLEEVACHNKIHDGWTILHGKVYNIGPYLHYHPGGVNILKPTLGKDGTELFEKYHRWVGIDNLIGKLLLGYIEEKSSKISMPPPRPRVAKLKNLLEKEDSEDEEDDESTLVWEENSS